MLHPDPGNTASVEALVDSLYEIAQGLALQGNVGTVSHIYDAGGIAQRKWGILEQHFPGGETGVHEKLLTRANQIVVDEDFYVAIPPEELRVFGVESAMYKGEFRELMILGLARYPATFEVQIDLEYLSDSTLLDDPTRKVTLTNDRVPRWSGFVASPAVSLTGLYACLFDMATTLAILELVEASGFTVDRHDNITLNALRDLPQAVREMATYYAQQSADHRLLRMALDSGRLEDIQRKWERDPDQTFQVLVQLLRMEL